MRRAFAALGTLLVAAAVTVGSGANFSATSANTGNVIKAGIVALSGTVADGSALLTVNGLAPGHTETGTVQMENTGDLDAVLTLTASNLVDAPASPALSSRLNFIVEDLTTSSTVYTGKLGAFSSADLGTWAPGARHTLRLSVAMPDGGAGGTDDAYKGARSTIDLRWRAVGADPDCPEETAAEAASTSEAPAPEATPTETTTTDATPTEPPADAC